MFAKYLSNTFTFYHKCRVDDILSGEGKEYYPNKTPKYVGEFEGYKYDGKGTLYYEQGEVKYKGEFKQGNYEGEGILFNNMGDKEYEGTFLEGKQINKGKGAWEGRGKKKYSSIVQINEGTADRAKVIEGYIIGKFKDGKLEEKEITFYTTSGDRIYAGTFQGGELTGEGEIYAPNNITIYKGE